MGNGSRLAGSPLQASSFPSLADMAPLRLGRSFLYSLSYLTPKYIRVDVWWVGLLHKAATLSAMIYVVLTLWMDETWAAVDYPETSLLIFVLPGAMYEAVNHTQYPMSSGGPFAYCSNDSYSFGSEPSFDLHRPRCEPLRISALTQLSTDRVFFETARYQTHTFSWPCEDPTPPALDCHTWQRTFRGEGEKMTCSCSTIPTTIHALAVEEAILGIHHSYRTRELSRFEGSSRVVRTDGSSSLVKPMVTFFEGPEGTTQAFKDGNPPALRLAEWLSAVTPSVSLDERNFRSQPDFRDPQKYPFVRTSGLRIEVEIEYSNKKDGRAQFFNDNVTAHVKMSVSSDGLTFGPSVEAEQIVSWEADGRVFSYSMLTHAERLGISFEFRSRGDIAVFDTSYVISVLVNFIIFITAARVVTDVIVFYFLPYNISSILMQKRVERVKLIDSERDAERAMKTVLHARLFALLDSGSAEPGVIDAGDLMRALAQINGMSAIAAVELTKAVMNDALSRATNLQTDRQQQKQMSKLFHGDEKMKEAQLKMAQRYAQSGRLTFDDFLHIMEGNDKDFRNFLYRTRKRADSRRLLLKLTSCISNRTTTTCRATNAGRMTSSVRTTNSGRLTNIGDHIKQARVGRKSSLNMFEHKSTIETKTQDGKINKNDTKPRTGRKFSLKVFERESAVENKPQCAPAPSASDLESEKNWLYAFATAKLDSALQIQARVEHPARGLGEIVDHVVHDGELKVVIRFDSDGQEHKYGVSSWHTLISLSVPNSERSRAASKQMLARRPSNASVIAEGDLAPLAHDLDKKSVRTTRSNSGGSAQESCSGTASYFAKPSSNEESWLRVAPEPVWIEGIGRLARVPPHAASARPVNGLPLRIDRSEESTLDCHQNVNDVHVNADDGAQSPSPSRNASPKRSSPSGSRFATSGSSVTNCSRPAPHIPIANGSDAMGEQRRRAGPRNSKAGKQTSVGSILASMKLFPSPILPPAPSVSCDESQDFDTHQTVTLHKSI